MRLRSFKKSSGLAALAVGLATIAIPSVASAQSAEQGRGGWNRGGEGRGGEVQQAPAPQQQAAPRNWDGDRDGAGRGWGGQARGGNVERPPQAAPQPQAERPMWRAAPQQQVQVQQAPQRQYEAQRQVEQQREQRWGSQDRTPRQRGWDGQRWQGQNWDRDGNRDRQVRTDPRYDSRGDGRRGDWNRGDWNRGDWGRNDRDWSRDWRRDNRYNWQSYRNQNRQVYNLGRYYSPYRNWSYSRLRIGFNLHPLFYRPNYWINDPWMYRLPPAYGPYRWVRYYDDALLVNIYDGEVVDVLYDFFW